MSVHFWPKDPMFVSFSVRQIILKVLLYHTCNASLFHQFSFFSHCSQYSPPLKLIAQSMCLFSSQLLERRVINSCLCPSHSSVICLLLLRLWQRSQAISLSNPMLKSQSPFYLTSLKHQVVLTTPLFWKFFFPDVLDSKVPSAFFSLNSLPWQQS